MFTLLHASSVNLLKEGGFKHFNYKIDPVTDKPIESHINSGLDASGPGMYNFNAKGKKEDISVLNYYSGDSGYIHISKIDIDKEDLLNNRDKYEIEKKEWIEFLDNFSEKIREINGYSIEDYENKMNEAEFLYESEELTNDKVIKIFDGYDINFEDDYLNIENFDDFESWRDDVDQLFFMDDPASHIEDNGGKEFIVNSAYEFNYNIWDVLNSIWLNAAIVRNNSEYKITYNETFYDSMMETIGLNHDLTAAVSTNDETRNNDFEENYNNNIFIVFDPSSEHFNIEKVLDANPSDENELSF